jgi:hypothetical protein
MSVLEQKSFTCLSEFTRFKAFEPGGIVELLVETGKIYTRGIRL